MIKIISFLIFSFGIILICRINIKKLSDDFLYKILSEDSKNKSIKKKIEKSIYKKENIFKKQILETESLLRITKKEKFIPILFLASLIFSALGILFALSIGNMYLIVSLGIGLFFVPFWIAEMDVNSAKKNISEDLETALSTITSTYIRSENIVQAIEENIKHMNEPIATFFKDFLVDIRGEKSIEEALEELRDKFYNPIFHEWIINLIHCQSDKTMKSLLEPTIAKMSSIRIINSESEVGFSSARGEFIKMVFFPILLLIGVRYSEKGMYDAFTSSTLGQIVLACVVAVIFFSVHQVFKITRPLEYK